MPHFTIARVEDVVPRKRQAQPSKRAQMQRQYQDALRNALTDRGQALIVELEPEDKALTIRNRIKRAAAALGYPDIVIRRRRNRIIAYLPREEPSDDLPA